MSGDAVCLCKLEGRLQRPRSHSHHLVLCLWQRLQSHHEVVRDLSSRQDAPPQRHLLTSVPRWAFSLALTQKIHNTSIYMNINLWRRSLYRDEAVILLRVQCCVHAHQRHAHNTRDSQYHCIPCTEQLDIKLPAYCCGTIIYHAEN